MSVTHTHTYTRARARTHTHTHTRALHGQTHIHTRARAHICVKPLRNAHPNEVLIFLYLRTKQRCGCLQRRSFCQERLLKSPAPRPLIALALFAGQSESCLESTPIYSSQLLFVTLYVAPGLALCDHRHVTIKSICL